MASTGLASHVGYHKYNMCAGTRTAEAGPAWCPPESKYIFDIMMQSSIRCVGASGVATSISRLSALIILLHGPNAFNNGF